jgi:DNA-binding CsgD family transcriptional regulator
MTRSPEVTARQSAVLELLQIGDSNKIIAHKLGMCESTVKVHVRNLMKLARATNRSQAAVRLRSALKSDVADLALADCDPVDTETAGRYLTEVCFGASRASGWHNDFATGLPLSPEQTHALFPTRIALCHSELSEALEGHRKNLPDDKLRHRPMAEVELADAAIRIFDLAGAMGYDLGAAIAEKLAFNAERADHKLDARRSTGGKAY